MIAWLITSLLGLCLLALGTAGCCAMRRRNMHLWVGPYLLEAVKRRVRPRAPPRFPNARRNVRHVLLCIADHFEPSWGDASDSVADARVRAWVTDYPRLLGDFRDSDGRGPRHTFFYPIDQYVPRHVDALGSLCRDGHGEIEIHLHHDNDTAENLERTLRSFVETFAARHGLLGRWPDGRPAYGFVHGNWALNNSRPDGRHCGVCDELDILLRTGCYADFTLPSAPDATQTRTINRIYYAAGRSGQRKSHDRGLRVGTGSPPENGLMLIQGPLGLSRPSGSLRPRIENACIQLGQAPSMHRLDLWMRANIHVPQRPDWLFVKLHTHGAKESNRKVLLGDAMLKFHRSLAARAAEDPSFRFHYVTAREMYNLAKAAEAGCQRSVADATDYQVRPPRPNNTLNGLFVARENMGFAEVDPTPAR